MKLTKSTRLLQQKAMTSIQDLKLLRPIDNMLDKHTPVKKCIRKQQTLVVKPWVTNGIKKSVSVSDKLCKVIIKAKNNQIIKERTRDLQNFQK